MEKRHLAIPIYLSPLIILFVLSETSTNNAYSRDGDSLGIPLFSYLFILFPITVSLFSQIDTEKLGKPQYFFRNSERPWASAITLIVTIYPLGIWWTAFLMIGFSTRSFATIFGCTLMLISLVLTRTYAIQPKLLIQEDTATLRKLKKRGQFDRRVIFLTIVWSICSVFCAIAHWRVALSYEPSLLRTPISDRAHYLIPLLVLAAALLRFRSRLISYSLVVLVSLWLLVRVFKNGLDLWNGGTCILLALVMVMLLVNHFRKPE